MRKVSIPHFGLGGALYYTGELSVLTGNKDGIPYFIYKTRRY